MTDKEEARDGTNADTARGPWGDARPGREKADPRTRGGQPPEKVEDRPVVGQVEPEDYPEQDRRDSRV